MARTLCLFLLLLSLCAPNSPIKAEGNFGIFRGELIVKALKDGRKLELTHPFSFIDPTGKLWGVPAGTVVDGASIPQAFWSIAGGPFEDKYREAAVIHDHYCEEKTDTWQNVHLVFYNAMRASGVGPKQAKLMYAAVYNFGPRWIEVRRGEKGSLISGQPVLLEHAKEAIIKFILENDPSIDDIQAVSTRISQIERAEQLEKILYENGTCTPILFEDVKRTMVLCGLSKPSKKHAALQNVRSLARQVHRLLYIQGEEFLPSVRKYETDPTLGNWQIIQERTQLVFGLIKLAIGPSSIWGAPTTLMWLPTPMQCSIFLPNGPLCFQRFKAPPPDR